MFNTKWFIVTTQHLQPTWTNPLVKVVLFNKNIHRYLHFNCGSHNTCVSFTCASLVIWNLLFCLLSNVLNAVLFFFLIVLTLASQQHPCTYTIWLVCLSQPYGLQMLNLMIRIFSPDWMWSSWRHLKETRAGMCLAFIIMWKAPLKLWVMSLPNQSMHSLTHRCVT